MKTQTTESLLVRRLLPAILLLTCGDVLAAVTTVTVHQGQDPAGKHVVLVVPLPSYEATIGIARQIGTLPLQRGTLTVIETKSIPKDEEFGDLLAETLPAELHPNWVWIHEGVVRIDHAGEKVTSPTIRLQAADDQPVREIAKRTFGDEVSVALIRPELPDELAAAGVLAFGYPSGTPFSRQIRSTRLLVTRLLRSRQLLAEDRPIWNGSWPSNWRRWGSTGSVATTSAEALWLPPQARSSRAAAGEAAIALPNPKRQQVRQNGCEQACWSPAS